MEHTCCKYMYISFRNKFRVIFRVISEKTSVLLVCYFKEEPSIISIFDKQNQVFYYYFSIIFIYSYLFALYICALSPKLSQLDMSLAEIWNEVSDWHNVYKTVHNTNMTEQRSGKSSVGVWDQQTGILLSLHSSMFPFVLDKSCKNINVCIRTIPVSTSAQVCVCVCLDCVKFLWLHLLVGIFSFEVKREWMLALVPCALVLWAKGPDEYQRGRMSIKYWCSHLKEQGERVGRDGKRDIFFFTLRNPMEKIRENNTGGTTKLLHWLASVILRFLVLRLKNGEMMTGATENDRGMKDRAEHIFKNMGQTEKESNQKEAGSRMSSSFDSDIISMLL